MPALDLSDPLPFGHDGGVGSTVGDRVRQRREALGLGVRELGRLVGKAGAYVSRLESSDRRPRSDTIQLLAEALRCRPAWLVSGALPVEASDDIPPDERYPNREQAIAIMQDQWPDELVRSLRTIVLWSDTDPPPSAWIQQGEQLRRLLDDGGRAMTEDDDEELG